MKFGKIEKRIKGYTYTHKWLVKYYGRSNKCENKICPHLYDRFEWSLLHGKKYKRNRENFWMLCSSCHRKYDKVNIGRKLTKKHKKLLSISHLGQKGTFGFLGKKHTEKTKEKMRNNHARYWLGKKHSKITKEKMRLAKIK